MSVPPLAQRFSASEVLPLQVRPFFRRYELWLESFFLLGTILDAGLARSCLAHTYLGVLRAVSHPLVTVLRFLSFVTSGVFPLPFQGLQLPSLVYKRGSRLKLPSLCSTDSDHQPPVPSRPLMFFRVIQIETSVRE